MLGNFGEKRNSGLRNVMRALIAFSTVTPITSPAFAQQPQVQILDVRVEKQLTPKEVEKITQDYTTRFLFTEVEATERISAFIDAMKKLSGRHNLEARKAFYSEVTKKDLLPVFLRVAFPSFDSLDTNLNQVANINVTLVDYSEKIYNMLLERKIILHGNTDIENAWAAVTIARNLMNSGETTLTPSSVAQMYRKVLELREKYSSLELFGPETIILSATEKGEDGRSQFTPDEMVANIKRKSRNPEGVQDFRLDTHGEKFKSHAMMKIVAMPAGSTIIINAHGMRKRTDFTLVFDKDDHENPKKTIKVSEIVDWFEYRYKLSPQLIEADALKPIKIIASECDGFFISQLLRRWQTVLGDKVSKPIIISETEENAYSLIDHKDVNKSRFFSQHIIQEDPKQTTQSTSFPTLGKLIDNMLAVHKRGGPRTKPMIFVPLTGTNKYMQIAEEAEKDPEGFWNFKVRV